MALALVCAVLIGLSLGALGSGGSIITLPVLVYVAHIDPRSAVGMSLAIVGATSAVGALLHAFQGHHHLKASAIVGLTGGAGAFLGSGFTHRLSGPAILSSFGVLMAVVGVAMLWRRPAACTPERCNIPRCALIGFGVGILTGLLGVGGGFLIVPGLVLLAGLETRKAIGASLAVIAANSVFGLIGQLRYTSLDLRVTLEFLVLAVAGMAAGVIVANRMDAALLRKAFAWFVIVIAAALLSLNIPALFTSVHAAGAGR